MRFVPDQPPVFTGGGLPELVEWIMRQFNRVMDEQESKNYLRLGKNNIEPAKPQDGMVYYADGTNWDPGTGQGIYYYNGSSWVKLG